MTDKPPTQQIIKAPERDMEYVPFGSQDKIKLSVRIIQNLVAVKTKSGKTCSEGDAIKFMMMCQARRLNPFEGDAFLIGYDAKDGPSFSLITAHQAFLKRAELHPEYDGMKSGIIIRREGEIKDVEGDFYLEGDEILGGWATVYFKNRKQAMHKRVRLKRFQKAWGIWQDDPAGMICKCAEADSLRSSFPTMLGGLYLREEIDPKDQVKLSTPVFSTPAITDKQAAETLTSAPENEEPGGPPETSEPATPAPAPAAEVSPVKRLRELCKEAKLKEAQVIEFLVGIGSLEPGVTTFEQAFLQNQSSVKMVVDQFEDISLRIKLPPG